MWGKIQDKKNLEKPGIKCHQGLEGKLKGESQRTRGEKQSRAWHPGTWKGLKEDLHLVHEVLTDFQTAEPSRAA